MVGYHAAAGGAGEDGYSERHRDTQFDSVNLGAPMRVEVATAPQYRDTQFDTMNLEPPMRVEGPGIRGTAAGAGEAHSAGYYPPTAPSSGHTPMNPAGQTKPTAAGAKHRMSTALVIASLALRAVAAVTFIIGLAVLASASGSSDLSVLDATGAVIDQVLSVSFSSFSSTKYALAAAIIGAVYSIYETVSAAVRLAMDHPLLPGKASLFVSYIGDQVMIVLVLTGASAAAATIKNLHDLPVTTTATFCDVWGEWCNKATGAVAMLFIGYCFLAASLVISSYCFYRNKS